MKKKLKKMKKEIRTDVFFFMRPNYREFIGKIHIVSNILLIFVKTGKLGMKVNSDVYEVDCNHMLFIHPHTEIILLEATDDLEYICISVPQVMKESATLQMDISFFVLLLKKPYWELDEKMQQMAKGFYNMFEYISDHLDTSIKTDLITSLFILFLRVLYEKSRHILPSETPLTSIAGRTLMSRFGKLLRAHFREDHRVAYYADLLCVTPKYLTQVIKSTIGVTPKDIIDRVLALESVYQLKHSELTIQQISVKLGFPDQSYFGRFFKRMFDISPIQFRHNPNMDVLQKLDEKFTNKYPNLDEFLRQKRKTSLFSGTELDKTHF